MQISGKRRDKERAALSAVLIEVSMGACGGDQGEGLQEPSKGASEIRATLEGVTGTIVITVAVAPLPTTSSPAGDNLRDVQAGLSLRGSQSAHKN